MRQTIQAIVPSTQSGIVLVSPAGWAVAIAVLAHVCLAQPGPSPAIVNLGTLAGDTSSGGMAISGDARVIVGGSGARAFRWTEDEGMQNLGLLPGASAAQAFAVSRDGLTVAGDCIIGEFRHGFRWTSVSGIQPIGAASEAVVPVVRAINGDGTTIIGCVLDTDTYSLVGFRWTSGGGIAPLLGGYFEVIPGGISADAATTTGSFGFSDFFRPFRQVANGPVENLGALPSEISDMIPGGWFAAATCISADGTVVAGWSSSFDGIKAFRWTTTGGMHALSPAGATVRASFTTAISGDGLVVAGYNDSPFAYAWLWTEQIGTVNLNDYLPTVGFELTDWVLDRVNGLSNDGRAMTGYGRFQGQVRAFRITGMSTALTGACCSGTSCVSTTADACTGVYLGSGAVCEFPGNPVTCCRANFNQTGGLSVQDIFDFLAAYFSGDVAADYNLSGTLSVQDIFDFVGAYFAGCL